ncbi:MAG TPA: ComEC/Rec2 family competence protein [Pyrinomonadaceae bacterium]|nr:ComEC/Rec2 family competence protein [Pyrinomonadaceae bacterium]
MIYSAEKTAAKNFSLFPLASLAVSFSGGILAASLLDISFKIWLVLLLVSVALTVLRLRQPQTATVFLFSAFLFLGAALFEIEKNSVASNRIQKLYDTGEINFETPLELTGVLSTEPEQAMGGAFLTVKVKKIGFRQIEQNSAGSVRLFVALSSEEANKDYENLELRYGAGVKILTTLSREDRFRNPGMTEFREILANKNLDAAGSLKSPLQIERLDDAVVFLPLAALYDWRQNLITQFRRNFSASTSGVLIASMLGNRHFLSQETAERFRVGGTFHILVISGLHITFIGVWVAWLVGKFTKNVWAQFFIANSLLWSYSLMVGAEVPVTRAAFMFTIFHAAVLFHRRATSLNTLGAATLILLALNPSDLFDQSFQLTFVSVAAIVAFAFPFWEKMREIGAWQPSQAAPAPPSCAKWLRTLCETIFWSEKDWQKSQTRTLWKCRLFKSELAKRLEEWHLQFIWQFVFGSILVSLVVQLWLLPLMAVYFHRFSVIAIFLNLFVGVLMAIQSIAAMSVLFLAQIHFALAQPLVWLCEVLNWLMAHSVEPFSDYTWASFRLPVYSGWMRAIYFVYFIPLIALAFSLHRWNPFQLTASSEQLTRRSLVLSFLIIIQCSLFAVIVFHPFSAPRPDGRLRVDFLDVGQGDSALITTPDGTTILIDGGGRPGFSTQKIQNEDGEIEIFEPDARSIGESVVCEFLWEKGLSKVDFLIPTHADSDHIDGLNDVARNFRIEAALVGRAPETRAEFRKFYESLRKKRIPMKKVARGDALDIGGVRIEVLHPVSDSDENAGSENDHSVVLRVIFGSRSFLLTGDIEKEAERNLLVNAVNLQADVVKIGHHGSRTSSIEDFVRLTNAEFAVASVGRESPFGHPHKEVVERWKNAGAAVLTTGENGTISFSTDGKDLRLETFLGMIIKK